MKAKSVYVWLVGLLAAGSLQAGLVLTNIIYTTSGFESYTNGTVAAKTVGGVTWVEWDQGPGGSNNNANPLLTQVQTNILHGGAKALAIADITNRVLARATKTVTNAVSYWDVYCKTEATNNFGTAQVTFRFSDASPWVLALDGATGSWYDGGSNNLITRGTAAANGRAVSTVLGR